MKLKAILFSLILIPIIGKAGTFSLPPLYVSEGRVIEQIMIPAGTPIQVALAQDVNSKMKPGTIVKIRIINPLVIKGKTVIPAGAIGDGIITRVKSKGTFGRKQMVEVQPQTILAIDGTAVPLYGTPVMATSKKWYPFGLIAFIAGIANFLAGVILVSLFGYGGEETPFILSGLIMGGIGIGLGLLKSRTPVIDTNTPLSANVNADTIIEVR